MNLLIMGLPGAGKGTQAEIIVRKYTILHISTGDMFRAAMKNETEMGKKAKVYIDQGALVPDDVTNGIVKERLSQADVRQQGFLLDGYPRTLDQAHALTEMLRALSLALDVVININVDPSILLDRISGRFICRTCGATYHKINKRPKVDGTCDICSGHDFYQRADDKPETVAARIVLNTKESGPVLNYYRDLGLVKDVEGSDSIDRTTNEVAAILDDLK